MSKRIIIDPITRISGFLEIEVAIEYNRVTDAKSSGLLFRGFEEMLQGRPPLDAIYFTERICGICSTAHAMGSTLALENALKVPPKENDKMIRDFMHGCEFLQNHIRQFYLYALPDYVTGPNISPLTTSNHTDFRIPKDLSKELNEDYIEALKISKMSHELLALFGGKAPHAHGIFVGGVTVNVDVSKLIKARYLLDRIKKFISTKMLRAASILSEYYPEYFNLGSSYKNLMSYGVYDYNDKDLFYVKPAVLLQGKVFPFHPSEIKEDISHAWYTVKSSKETSSLLPPTMEQDVTPDLNKEGAYSFIRAPRYAGFPMEVGPLARMYLSGNYTRGISAMDRNVARVLETNKIASIMSALLERIKPLPAAQQVYTMPKAAFGAGLIDTTRGGLGHWISIKDQKIKDYNVITPTAWNLSPTDAAGTKGVIEKALIGTPIKDETNPVEIGRIVRSFDPCVSCATHIVSSLATDAGRKIL